jgi:hypothetical protein
MPPPAPPPSFRTALSGPGPSEQAGEAPVHGQPAQPAPATAGRPPRSPAEHHHLEPQQRQRRGNPNTEHPAVPHQALLSSLIAGVVGARERIERNRLCKELRMRIPPYYRRSAAQQCTHAGVLLEHPNPVRRQPRNAGRCDVHHHVSDLAGSTIHAAPQTPFQNDRSANPSPQGHVEEALYVVRSSVQRLCPCGNVGIVVQQDRAAEPLLQSLLQREVPQSWQIGRKQQLTPSVDETGNTDPHSGKVLHVQRLQLPDKPGKELLRGCLNRRLHNPLMHRLLRAGRQHHQLGSAGTDINAHEHRAPLCSRLPRTASLQGAPCRSVRAQGARSPLPDVSAADGGAAAESPPPPAGAHSAAAVPGSAARFSSV